MFIVYNFHSTDSYKLYDLVQVTDISSSVYSLIIITIIIVITHTPYFGQ